MTIVFVNELLYRSILRAKIHRTRWGLQPLFEIVGRLVIDGQKLVVQGVEVCFLFFGDDGLS